MSNQCRHRRPTRLLGLALGVLALLAPSAPARAGKLTWLDDVMQEVVREARVGGRTAVRRAEGTGVRAAGRLFVHEADDGLALVTKRFDDFARLGRRAETPTEALLEARFARLLRPEPEMLRTFSALAPAEKRLVVEMGETAQLLARRYPREAETMIRKLGPEGMAAVRVYGDEVAEVIAKEGPESLGVLRKTGRGGWGFFTRNVLPHKKKLIAAGVLAVFLANPEKFVDTAGNVTEYAVNQFARAGIRLAGAVGGGAARGLESAIGQALASTGLGPGTARTLGMGLAALVAVLAAMVLLGIPTRWLFAPFRRLAGLVRGRRSPARAG